MDELGRQVKQLREEKGWTQVQLAVHAGTSPTVVNQVETGKRKPSIGTVEKLATALEVEIAELFRVKANALPRQLSFNNGAEVEAGLSWPDEAFRRAVMQASTEQLRKLVKALAGNQPAPVLEDFRLNREAALRAGIERVKVFAHAEVVREELIARDDEPPEEYLPDLRKRLEALGID